jgi:hypothetical protein
MIRKLVQKLFKQDKVTELADLTKKEYLTIFQYLKNEGVVPQNYEPPKLEVIGKLKFFKNYYLKS